MTGEEAKAPTVVALVEWIDAGIVATRWEDEAVVRAEADRLTTGTIRSAGLLLRMDDESVILAVAYNPNSDDVSLAMVIPRSAIRRIEIWSPLGPPADG